MREKTGDERRVESRIPVYERGALIPDGAESQRARLLDVSTRGAFVSLTEPVDRDTLCTLRFVLRGCPVVVRVLTRWGRPTGQPEPAGNGVEFLDLGLDQTALIAGLDGLGAMPCELRPSVRIQHDRDRSRLTISVLGSLAPVSDLLERRTLPALSTRQNVLVDARRYEIAAEPAQPHITQFLSTVGRSARQLAIVLPQSAIGRVQLLRLLRVCKLGQHCFCTGELHQAQRYLDGAST